MAVCGLLSQLLTPVYGSSTPVILEVPTTQSHPLAHWLQINSYSHSLGDPRLKSHHWRCCVLPVAGISLQKSMWPNPANQRQKATVLGFFFLATTSHPPLKEVDSLLSSLCRMMCEVGTSCISIWSLRMKLILREACLGVGGKLNHRWGIFELRVQLWLKQDLTLFFSIQIWISSLLWSTLSWNFCPLELKDPNKWYRN